jgi:toxin ParE1/3/4
MTYVLAPSAARDLEILWQHLAGEASEAIADRVIDAISERCEMLAGFPKAGRLRPGLGLDVRCFPVESHLIYYRQENARIVIARVLHGSRDQAATFQEPAEDGPSSTTEPSGQ